MTLGDIVNDRKGVSNKAQSSIKVVNVDKYIIELIRISELYKFELKIKIKNSFKKINNEKNKLGKGIFNIQDNIELQLNKLEIEEETFNESKESRNYRLMKKNNDTEDVKIIYNTGTVKIKDSAEYKVEKPKNIMYQELWEKEGFYQEKTQIAKVKVQLWPEHLPYDHLKRKRAFLFC